ncbi:hypothetical protein Aple_003510 [Acrocarpospora pleiomorpha]|uniref:Glucose-methanol-choline oxidoreductase C-terminal domain-containing protein n=1 Tax=Acrocarpospora pleiomorpha TaxID=90975 RepID=A0A5M3X9W7_9ACTN|nr:GMC oxidoreductase [Acrocarpospora pleiomorpha]GES17456.1 hypothetical protein Aple_003510 [Acrocarpospora pleiomorpha]
MTDGQFAPTVHDDIELARRMLIGGEWVGALSGKTFPVYGPADGRVIVEVPAGDAADVDRAVAAARGPLPPPSGNLGEATLLLDSEPGRASADLQIVFIHVPFTNPWQAAPEHGYTFGVGHMRPASRGSLTLASPDPKVPPLIDFRYLHEGHDLRALVSGVRHALEISETTAFDEWRGGRHPLVGADDERIAAFVRDAVQSYGHAAGSCRMGVDSLSVVDPELRVQGLAGLRVADASVMPEIVSTNTNAAAVMIAEKASDLLRGLTSASA